MSSRISKLTSSLRELGEIQVTDYDFMDLLNKDLKELEISRSMKRMASIRVMEWDFRTVLPAMNRLAQHEVDVVGLVKRTAGYKVMEWDFRNTLAADTETEIPTEKQIEPQEMQALAARLKNFLHYLVANLIDEPKYAHIKVQEITPGVLRFRLILVKRDVAMLIGREGQTASAIRSILKSSAAAQGAHALLLIHSHEEEAAMQHELD